MRRVDQRRHYVVLPNFDFNAEPSGLAVRRLEFVEIGPLGLRFSLTLGRRVGLAIEKSLSYGVSRGASEAFNLVWLAVWLPLGIFLGRGAIDWVASRGRRAVCASWGLSRTYLPSLEQTLGPFPGPRLIPVPARVVQVREDAPALSVP